MMRLGRRNERRCHKLELASVTCEVRSLSCQKKSQVLTFSTFSTSLKAAACFLKRPILNDFYQPTL